MKLLHRIVCLLRGHVSYERINVPSIPQPAVGSVAVGSIAMNAATNALSMAVSDPAGNIIWSPVSQRNSINYTAGPLHVSLHVCARCHHVYWDTRVDLGTLAHASAVPELADFVAWRKREEWEQRQREANEVVGGAYRGYQMALKMTQGIPPDPPQTN